MTRPQHTLNHNYSQAPHPQTHNTPYHLSFRTTPIQHHCLTLNNTGNMLKMILFYHRYGQINRLYMAYQRHKNLKEHFVCTKFTTSSSHQQQTSPKKTETKTLIPHSKQHPEPLNCPIPTTNVQYHHQFEHS